MKQLMACLLALTASALAQDGFTSLFSGKDLAGWDGDPKLWKVEDGVVIGTCSGPDALANNTFLIWRSGQVADFELRATVRVVGDNNSGIQYRSRELPEVAPWVITGYQCDIHPALEHTGMTYEEKGRALAGLLAIQLHRGNANSVHIKDLRLKTLTDGKMIAFDAAQLPAGATRIEKPRTSRPQGAGAVVTPPKK